MRLTLPEIALRRPITVWVVAITVMGLGVIARYRTPIEFLPPLDFPFIFVQIPYIGASPEQAEKEVAIPAEGEFRTVSHLKRISSTSDSNGCRVQLLFEMNADMTAATAEVRDRIERLKLTLPSEIDQISIRRFNANTLPIMVFSIYGGMDDEELVYRVRTLLRPRLQRLEGVADVTVYGTPEKEVLIEFDQDALGSRSLSLFEIVSALRQSSLNLTVGNMVEGDSKYIVRALGEFIAPEELGELVIGPNAVRLRDVARVGYRARERESDYSIDGKPGTLLVILKEAEANTISTCQAVEAELNKLKDDPDFGGAQVFTFFNQSDTIVAALNGLVQSGELGAALAVIILFLFMWRIRPTIIVALSIPTSVVFGLVYLFLSGMTLNLVTMISFIVALGMLVDNAIVVIEDIYRHQQLGYSPAESAKLGTMEVAMAITASTLTTIVVGIPMFYLDAGEMSTYMKQFFGPITVSLLASLLIALTLIPLAASKMDLHRGGRMAAWRRLFRGKNAVDSGGDADTTSRRTSTNYMHLPRLHPLRAIVHAYGATLAWTQRWRLATMSIVVAVSLITLIPMYKLNRQGDPSVDSRRIEVSIILDQGFNLEGARATFNSIREAVDTMRKELGIKNIFSRYSSGGGDFDVYLLTQEDLAPGETLPYTTDQVLDILRQRLPQKLPGGEIRYAVAEANETAARSFTLQVRGSDSEVLEKCAENLKSLMLSNIPQVAEVNTDISITQHEIQLNVNTTLADVYGLTPMTIAQTVDFALRGVRLSYLKQGGREIPVWAQFQEEDRKSKSNLENVSLFGKTGEQLPINRVVDFVKERSPKAISRVNGKNVVTLNAKLRGTDMGRAMTGLKALLASFQLPQGYSIEFGDELMNLETNMSSFLTSLVMAAILVYLVMGALFESYLLPISILSTLPLAGVGTVWLLYLTDTPIDIVGMIGMILMVGVVVNNGIVLVDYINQLRARGVPRAEAVLSAGHDRFRPVMMTALTTILGCVPLAMGGGGVETEVSFTSLGRALIGGLTSATFLTLFIVPITYTLVDDARVWLSNFFGGLMTSLRGETPAASEPAQPL
ncbi:MAG: efflux RND transporter permease subunit [Candidatus Hydrogenedentes bacterium]|nr:efflux RND transporter permease subunit [Candidatus Hydrogenedentota bacterium]